MLASKHQSKWSEMHAPASCSEAVHTPGGFPGRRSLESEVQGWKQDLRISGGNPASRGGSLWHRPAHSTGSPVVPAISIMIRALALQVGGLGSRLAPPLAGLVPLHKSTHLSEPLLFHVENIPDNPPRTFLVVQWLRICLPMQGIWVQSLVQEDPTCCGATKPVGPQLLNLSFTAHVPQLLKPAYPRVHALPQERPLQ